MGEIARAAGIGGARKPPRLTAPAPWLFLIRTGYDVFIEFVRRSARGTAQFPFTLGRGVFPLVSPDIAGRRLGFACGRHRVMLAAGDSDRLPISTSPESKRELSPVPTLLKVVPFPRLKNFQCIV